MAGPLEDDTARAANQRHVPVRVVNRHDVIERAFAGDDERGSGDTRAQSAAASIVAIIRARPAIRASDSGAPKSVLSCKPAKCKRAGIAGNAAAISRRSRQGVSARNSGPSR